MKVFHVKWYYIYKVGQLYHFLDPHFPGVDNSCTWTSLNTYRDKIKYDNNIAITDTLIQ